MRDWIEEDDCAMESKKYEGLKRAVQYCANDGWGIKDMVAEIYNLYQEYLISEEQENELYAIADPEELYNSPSEYWHGDYGCLPIWKYVEEE